MRVLLTILFLQLEMVALPHSFRVYFMIFSTRSSGFYDLPHSFRVYFRSGFEKVRVHATPLKHTIPTLGYIFIESGITLETSGEDVKLHSKRVEKM
jgi:hypothetical protein